MEEMEAIDGRSRGSGEKERVAIPLPLPSPALSLNCFLLIERKINIMKHFFTLFFKSKSQEKVRRED